MPEAEVRTQESVDTLDEPWRRWHGMRHPAQLLHLDTAAAGRCSSGTLRAVAEHAERETARGAYVAEAEAQPVLEAGRADLAGLLGVQPAGVAFVESATAALQALLAAWPLRPGDRVGVMASEWGPNLAAFEHAGLTGPRGVGLLAVAEPWWDRLRVHVSPLDRAALPGASPVRYLQSHEAHVPGRVGLATAVREFLETGPERVWARLAEVGTLTREALRDLPGWAVTEPAGAPCAITALRPTAGQDIGATRARLIEAHGIVTTSGAVQRAPRDMTGPLLRISPHVDCAPGALSRLRAALAC